MDVIYNRIEGASDTFCVQADERNQIVSIRNADDAYGMNWVNNDYAIWGEIRCNVGLSAKIVRRYTERDSLLETYIFKNETDFDIYLTGTELGICLPFPDYYTDALTCMTQCCNTHVWCGGASSYIMALRMGGKPPHLGVILREGAWKGYSIERKASTAGREENVSNQRGCIILHPENFHLKPGEEYILSWELVWFEGKEDFRERLLAVPDFVYIESDAFLVLGEQNPEFSFSICTSDKEERPLVMNGEKEIAYCWENGCGNVKDAVNGAGEYRYEIVWKGKRSYTTFFAQLDLEELAYRRCKFIAENQQCHDKESYLNGAYLIYDNEEKYQYYEHLNDHNGGRERIGMGVLMAYYLWKYKKLEKTEVYKKLQDSLNQFTEYVLRELFDEKTGEVFNDAPRCRDYIRLYNYPWISRFFLEMYQLSKKEKFLEYYYKSVEYFYQEGGTRYYAIGMPMYESIQIFRESGKEEQAERLLAHYEKQGEYILACGENYPAHEVDYEQSIVAPAAIYMCELYRLTGSEKYYQAAKDQIGRLELFQGFQPDYHLNEVAIRHWDGYWFGKRKCLGDTYPHYWSALSGYAYAQMDEIMEGERYGRMAKKTLSAVLSLFSKDGNASCAMVYPMSVNGVKASFYDPWANDQDWGLYFALKYLKM